MTSSPRPELLDLQLDRDKLDIGDSVPKETLEGPRAFERCLRLEVLPDTADPAHLSRLRGRRFAGWDPWDRRSAPGLK